MPASQDWSEQADALHRIMVAGGAMRDPGITIHAGAIRQALLACAKSGEGSDPHGLHLIGATIKGVLDLSDLSTSAPLRFVNCVFCDQIVADGATITRLEFKSCTLLTRQTAVRAEGLAVSGDVVLDGFTASADGESTVVNFAAAAIGRDFVIRNADLKCESGTAVDMGGISVKGSVRFENVQAAAQPEDVDAVARASGGITFWLSYATISGRLIFDGAELRSARGSALIAEGLRVGGDLEFTATANSRYDCCSLKGSKIGGTLHLEGARITSTSGNGLAADGIEVGGDALFSDRFLARTRGLGDRAVSLVGAKIGGNLSFEGARLRAKYGTALDAAQMTVSRTAEFKNARASGAAAAVELGSVKIGSHLTFDGARLTSRNGTALAADYIAIGGEATFANDFLASTKCSVDRPAVRLGGAKIGSQLDLTGARLNNLHGTTLAADSVSVAADAFLDDLRASSGFRHPVVRLVNARIGGKLDCRALDVDRCVSHLNLMHAEVGTFRLNTAYGGSDSRWVVLDGLSYKGIPSDDMSLDEWIDTLKNRTPQYCPQPWHQLGVAHNAIGHDQDARKILIEQHVDYRDRVLIRQPGQRVSISSAVVLWCRRLGSRFLKVFTGYGYRSHRAFLLLLAVAAFSVALTTLGAGKVHVTSPPPTQRYVAQLSPAGTDSAPCSLSEQIGLGLQIGLPLIKPPAGDRCRLDTNSSPGQVFTFISWVLQAFAWVFATLAVAGYTGLIRKV